MISFHTQGTMNDEATSPVTPIRVTPALTVTKKKGNQRCFSNSEKLSIMRGIEKRKEDGISIGKSCTHFNISPRLLCKWRSKFERIEKASNPKAKCLHDGPTQSILVSIEEDLLRFLFELREQGMPVTTHMIVLQVQTLNPMFAVKTHNAKRLTVQ